MRKLLYSILFSSALLPANTQSSLILLAESLRDLTKQAPAPKEPQQAMPYSSFWGESPTGIPQNFIKDCKKLALTENAKIPIPAGNTLRIASYNVHFWSTPKIGPVNHENLNGIMDTIKNLNASVLILQEVGNNTPYMPMLQEYGYNIRQTCTASDHLYGGFFGNMIASKRTLSHKSDTVFAVPGKTAPERRCFVNIKTKYRTPSGTGITISVYGTHLDVFDNSGSARDHELQELFEHINGNTAKGITADTSEIIIVGADFNAFRKDDYNPETWQKILANTALHMGEPISAIPTQTLDIFKTNGFVDSFTFGNQKGPGFTVWTGTVVDFIFIKDKRSEAEKTKAQLKTKSYVYYSAASDHIPVILDIELKE